METLSVRPIEPARVADTLATATAPRCDTTAGAQSLAELCRRGIAFEVTAGGRRVGAYTLEMADHDAARVAWIMAAAGGMPGIDGVASLLPVIEAQAVLLGATQLGVVTRRAGLVKKLRRHGFAVTGVMLRKELA